MVDTDPYRETRTMVLLSLPFPPIPAKVLRVEADEMCLSETQVESTTHTFLAILLQANMGRGDAKLNRARQKRQINVFRAFLHGLADGGFNLDGEALYQFYCRFSRDHIATYFEEGFPPELVITPLSQICVGDRGHSKMVEYMAAQSILFEDDPVKTQADYRSMSYLDMLKVLRGRLGHAATREELRMIDEQEAAMDEPELLEKKESAPV